MPGLTIVNLNRCRTRRQIPEDTSRREKAHLTATKWIGLSLGKALKLKQILLVYVAYFTGDSALEVAIVCF